MPAPPARRNRAAPSRRRRAPACPRGRASGRWRASRRRRDRFRSVPRCRCRGCCWPWIALRIVMPVAFAHIDEPSYFVNYQTMKEGPDISIIAALIGNPASANMLMALMAGPALTATELAHEAGLMLSTASGHLAKLENAGLVAVER